jgi:hypothetical protein
MFANLQHRGLAQTRMYIPGMPGIYQQRQRVSVLFSHTVLRRKPPTVMDTSAGQPPCIRASFARGMSCTS